MSILKLITEYSERKKNNQLVFSFNYFFIFLLQFMDVLFQNGLKKKGKCFLLFPIIRLYFSKDV